MTTTTPTTAQPAVSGDYRAWLTVDELGSSRSNSALLELHQDAGGTWHVALTTPQADDIEAPPFAMLGVPVEQDAPPFIAALLTAVLNAPPCPPRPEATPTPPRRLGESARTVTGTIALEFDGQPVSVDVCFTRWSNGYWTLDVGSDGEGSCEAGAFFRPDDDVSPGAVLETIFATLADATTRRAQFAMTPAAATTERVPEPPDVAR